MPRLTTLRDQQQNNYTKWAIKTGPVLKCVTGIYEYDDKERRSIY